MLADTSDPDRTAVLPDSRRRWRTRAAWLLGGITAFRILVIATTQLADGEAYYYLWSRFPALSYYDHPPLVAWMTWLTTRFSHGGFAVRFGPVVCSTIFLVLLYRLGEKLFSPRAGFIAVAIISALPAFLFTGFVLNPESPLAPIWVLDLLIVEGMRERDEAWRPLAAGLVTGLAFLAKYTGILLVPITLLYLAASPSSRRWLRRPALYLGGGVALLVALPVIVWNYQHQWASLTLHFVERTAAVSLTTTMHSGLQVLIGQLTAFQPLIFPGLMAALVVAIRRSGRDDRYRFLALTSWPVLLFFFITMVRVRDSESHWTMVGYMPVALAAGGWLDEVMDHLPRSARVYLRSSFGLSVVVALVVWGYALTHFLPGFVPASAYDANRDFFNEQVGWDQVKAEVAEDAAVLGQDTVVASTQYALCAHILSELDDQPRVYCPSVSRTEFDFLGRHDPPAQAPVVYINNDHYGDDPSLLLPGRHCRSLKTISIERAGRVLQHYRLYTCPPAGSHELIVPRDPSPAGEANDRSG
jgi:dolichol-phosphate mannosyltransferase